MKLRKIISLSLFFIMLLGLCAVPVCADDGISVFISISKNGKLVKDKNGCDVAMSELELSGKEAFTLLDAFSEAHKQYYEGGEDGFSFADGAYGSYVKKFWGDDSENFGYQVCGADKVVMSCEHILKDGDTIDFAIYENPYPATESYTKFDKFTLETVSGKEESITLLIAGYDEEWNTVFSPCADAVITVNSEITSAVTDENGTATVVFDKPGEYILSAVKTKEVAEKEVTAITAPVCKVFVNPSPLTVIENIAKKYSTSAICDDANMPWFLADMASYKMLYPESEYTISDKTLQTCMDTLIELSEEATRPSDLAKCIIAMRSAGYDPSDVYNKNSKHINVVEKLLQQVDEKSDGVTNVYTLPYVIIALREYASDDQTDFLVSAALSAKEEWSDTTYGPDAASTMFAALAPYYETNNDVKTVIDEIISTVKETQKEDGLIDSMGAAASTGLAMVGFSALGIDAETVTNNGNSLVDGLMTEVSTTFDGFLPVENSFSTEQGFRGLLAWQMLQNGMTMYDFSGNTKNTLYATVKRSGGGGGGGKSVKTKEEDTKPTEPVQDDTTEPQKEDTTEPAEEEQPETVDTEQTEATEKTEPDINFVDVKKDAWYYEDVKFAVNSGLMKGTDIGFEPETAVTRAMFVTILFRLDRAEKPDTATPFTDIQKDAWYYNEVGWAFKNGIVSGISDSEFAPASCLTREQLAVLLYRYVNFKDAATKPPASDIINNYSDLDDISDYAKSAMLWATGIGLINGETGTTLNPKNKTTRAQLAAILNRFCQMQGETK